MVVLRYIFSVGEMSSTVSDAHALAVVAREAMRDAAAAVVADDVEALDARARA